jgi:hypothetical protein
VVAALRELEDLDDLRRRLLVVVALAARFLHRRSPENEELADVLHRRGAARRAELGEERFARGAVVGKHAHLDEPVRGERGVELSAHRGGRAVVADRDDGGEVVRFGALELAFGCGEDECGHATIIGARWRRAAKARSSTRPGCTSISPIRT